MHTKAQLFVVLFFTGRCWIMAYTLPVTRDIFSLVPMATKTRACSGMQRLGSASFAR